jgi:hypothetical protein
VAVGDASVSRWNSECAIHRNESVSARALAGTGLTGRRDREASHAGRKRDRRARLALASLPVVVDDVAVAKVLYAGAADLAEP